MAEILLDDTLHRKLLQHLGVPPINQDEMVRFPELALQVLLEQIEDCQVDGISYDVTKSDNRFIIGDQSFPDYRSAIAYLIADDLSSSEKYQPPKGAQAAAKKVLKWKEEHPDEIKGMTATGWTRAKQLANGKPLSFDVVKRMSQFARHKKNSAITPEHEGEPWKDAGYVAWLGWGDDVGINWAQRIVEQVRKEANEDAITDAGEKFTDKKLHSQAYNEAKKEYNVFPSAYASGFIVQEYERLYKEKHGSLKGAYQNEDAMDEAAIALMDFYQGMVSGCLKIAKDGYILDNLKEWFGNWVRINSSGEVVGSCGGRSEGEGYPKCLPRSRAENMTKEERIRIVRRKRRAERENPGQNFVSSDPDKQDANDKLTQDDNTPVHRVVTYRGLQIGIQYEVGQQRMGVVLPVAYGELMGTKGEDGSPIDIYFGNHLDSDRAFQVSQLNKEGKFDEYKVMIGFSSAEDAEQAFKRCRPANSFGGIKEISWEYLRKQQGNSQDNQPPNIDKTIKQLADTLSAIIIPNNPKIEEKLDSIEPVIPDSISQDAYEDLIPEQQKEFNNAIAALETEGQHPKDFVHYQDISPYGIQDKKPKCFHCAYVAKDSPEDGLTSCAIVQGAIYSSGWCDRGLFPPKWVEYPTVNGDVIEYKPRNPREKRYVLKSQKRDRVLGYAPTLAKIQKREKQVNYYKKKKKSPLSEVKDMDSNKDEVNISPDNLLEESDYEVELTPEVIEETIAAWEKEAPPEYKGILNTKENGEQ